ncbi:MAG: hypothetical protein ABR574_12030, partial [Cryomorphaceae bacterium]
MKTLFTFLVSLSIATLSAQIPNANFESWVEEDGFLTPEDWEPLIVNDVSSVTQDLDSYEGIYAMQVEALKTGVGSSGNASTTVDIDFIPASLDFYAKASSEFGFVSVEITFYNQEDP